jgi:3-phenylpropionate/trans-cinnamate dioxygenase ferredoxin subunit
MSLPEVLDSLGGDTVAEQAGPDTLIHSGWAQVLPVAELPPGQSTKVYLGSQQIALFNVRGEILAISNRCPHARGPLCEGQVTDQGGTVFVTCPWHKADFDLHTGEALEGPVRTPVQAFVTQIRDDGFIYVADKAYVESADRPVAQVSSAL